MLENDYYIMDELRKEAMKKGQQKKTGFFESGRNQIKVKHNPILVKHTIENVNEFENNKGIEFIKVMIGLTLFFGFIVGLLMIL